MTMYFSFFLETLPLEFSKVDRPVNLINPSSDCSHFNPITFRLKFY
jgi:hypothetical protein